MFFATDINECVNETDNCNDELSSCNNTEGSFVCTRNLNCSKQIFSTLQEDNSKINVNSSSYSTVRFSCGLVLQECFSRTAILNYKAVLKCRIKLKL